MLELQDSELRGAIKNIEFEHEVLKKWRGHDEETQSGSEFRVDLHKSGPSQGLSDGDGVQCTLRQRGLERAPKAFTLAQLMKHSMQSIGLTTRRNVEHI